MMEESKKNDDLIVLVENHDIVALEHVMPKDPHLMFSFDLSSFRQNKPRKMQDYLRSNKSAVERACELGYLDVVTVFLKHGCSPNLPTSDGRLIHSVLNCLKSRRELIENKEGLKVILKMISLHCDFNIKDYNHKSPLMLAAELSDGPILRLILSNCMDWQLYPTSGFTPLHMGCLQGNLDCVRQLVTRMTPASLNTSDNKRYTPVMYSVKMLENNFKRHDVGEDLEEEEKKLWIMQFMHIAVIEFLLASGATFLPENGSLLSEYSLTLVHALVRIINDYEFLSNFAMYEGIPFFPLQKEYHLMRNTYFLCTEGVLDIQEDDEEIDIIEKSKKVISPYSCLMRLFIHAGLNIFKYDSFQKWNERNSCIRSFFLEVKCVMKQRSNVGKRCVPTLLSLCRSTIRLQVGKCHKLHNLELLPLPWKLICYIMFLSF